jgi:hypothetical protein
MDAGPAPEQVGSAHAGDQVADFGPSSWSTANRPQPCANWLTPFLQAVRAARRIHEVLANHLSRLALTDQSKTDLESKVSFADHITFNGSVPEASYVPLLVEREIAKMEATSWRRTSRMLTLFQANGPCSGEASAFVVREIRQTNSSEVDSSSSTTPMPK